MDSFYDAPRRPPIPTATERLLRAPVVPEISVLCQQNAVPVNEFTSYNQWKTQQVQSYNKENICSPQNTSYLKKQVRFESPVLQQRPSLSFEPILPKNVAKPAGPINLTPLSEHNNKVTSDFQHLYMSNIPNRHLDLSMVEPPKNMDAEILSPNARESNAQNLPKTYQDFRGLCEKQGVKLNDSITDILNYKKIDKPNINVTQKNNKRNEEKKDNILSMRTKNYSKILHNYKLDEQNLKRGTTNTSTSKSNITQEDHHLNENHVVKSDYEIIDKSNEIRGGTSVTKFKCVDSEVQTALPTFELRRKCDCDTSVVPKSDEPTVRDLLKIISQQNEQLLLLQKQVATLISRDDNKQTCNKQIENVPQQTARQYITSTHHENQVPKNNVLPKFSIDLMTSFEVSVKRQQHHNHYQSNNILTQESEIQGITETETQTNDGVVCDKTGIESTGSFCFKEPLQIRETVQSPEPSIQIDMNDFEDSDDEEPDEVSSCDVGATFYNNLMEQVNQILRNAQLQSDEGLYGQHKGDLPERMRDTTMNKVKQATLRHLQSIGVHVDNMEGSSGKSSSSEELQQYNSAEVSFAVQQLLMKYLPSEQLSKVTYKQSRGQRLKSGIIPNRPEFSFATVQYMKKYNLIATNSNNDIKRPPQKVTKQQIPTDPQKILDITSLKQQPKLL